MSESLQAKTKKGLMFRSIESISMQVTSFVLQMVLARLLAPEHFGVIAILTTFTNIANTLVNNGLGSAIVQRKNATRVDISTVFYIELAIGVLAYIAMFIGAPAIATFYENAKITWYLRVFAITQLANPFASIQLTVGKCRMDFRPSLVANLAATVVQGGVGIFMALNDYGVWALVIAQVSNHLVRATVLCLMTRWVPALKFSFKSFKSLFGYSWKLFAGWMIGTLYQDAFSWIIGKAYDSQVLGFYSKGHSIPAIVNKVATQVTNAVMFASISKNQDDIKLVKAQTRSMIAVTCAMILPVMAGLAGCADSLVRVVLSEKWLGAVPVIQLMCIPLALNVISNANMQSINAVGRSDLFLWMEIFKRGVTIALVLVFAWLKNFNMMLLSIAAGGVISLCVNTISNKKLFDYRPFEYAMDILPYALCSGVLLGAVSAMMLVDIHLYARLAIQLTLCAVLYGTFIFSGLLPGYKSIRVGLLGMVRRKTKKKKVV